MSSTELSRSEIEQVARRRPPVVSVVIPAYRAAPYIGCALESVLRQSFRGYEVIVINDGSPDTEALENEIAPYRHRIRYVRQANRGPGVARNRGIRVARGEYVAFLDADDRWRPEYLAEQVTFLRRNPSVDLVYADARIVGASTLAGRTFMQTCPSRGKVTMESLLTRRCTVITSGVVARRDVLIDAGLFDEEIRCAEDYHLWVRIARQGRLLRYQRKVLLEYRVRDDSYSSDRLSLLGGVLHALEKIRTLDGMSGRELRALRICETRVRGEMALELGKAALERGDVATAQRQLRRAFRGMRSYRRRQRLKLFSVLLSLHFAPRLAQIMYGRRLRREEPARVEMLG